MIQRVSYLWETQLRHDLKAVTICMVGIHEPTAPWDDNASRECVNCGKRL